MSFASRANGANQWLPTGHARGFFVVQGSISREPAAEFWRSEELTVRPKASRGWNE
jgi:hypothetical protein